MPNKIFAYCIAMGTLLNIKPIITIGDDGKYHTFTKVRGRAKVVSAFIKRVEKMTVQNSAYKVYFTHGAGQEVKERIKKEVVSRLGSQRVEDWGWISPVACVHCGPGFVGMLIQQQ